MRQGQASRTFGDAYGGGGDKGVRHDEGAEEDDVVLPLRIIMTIIIIMIIIHHHGHYDGHDHSLQNVSSFGLSSSLPSLIRSRARPGASSVTSRLAGSSSDARLGWNAMRIASMALSVSTQRDGAHQPFSKSHKEESLTNNALRNGETQTSLRSLSVFRAGRSVSDANGSCWGSTAFQARTSEGSSSPGRSYSVHLLY
ncbi:hypothetical protein BP6252_01608 [Coleophoma cylindrospora]|uniref:Uncharacterized protein n=1 Tax=Coleophoma cylindrospora TaxID=1849047 RepID=A0A3D8STE1_9HELO|nr:hypothetical protein BP6252_01608 [Coleophoma cylindrospora]